MIIIALLYRLLVLRKDLPDYNEHEQSRITPGVVANYWFPLDVAQQ